MKWTLKKQNFTVPAFKCFFDCLFHKTRMLFLLFYSFICWFVLSVICEKVFSNGLSYWMAMHLEVKYPRYYTLRVKLNVEAMDIRTNKYFIGTVCIKHPRDWLMVKHCSSEHHWGVQGICINSGPAIVTYRDTVNNTLYSSVLIKKSNLGHGQPDEFEVLDPCRVTSLSAWPLSKIFAFLSLSLSLSLPLPPALPPTFPSWRVSN